MSVIFKPGTNKGAVILLDKDVSTPPTITLKDGSVITAKRAGQGAPGVYKGDNGYQWVFPEGAIQGDEATITADGKSQSVKNTTSSWRGEVGSLQESSKGAAGPGTSSSLEFNGGGGKFGSSQQGYGVAPAYIGDLFPKVQSSSYDPITGAAKDYKIGDPVKFGQQFSPFQRNELKTNFGQAKDFALDTIDTELSGLKNYAPAAAALKRNQTAQDNTFNQGQRTDQVNTAVPDVVKDLNRIAGDARTYANGDIPNAVINAGMNFGTRSAAADAASGSGFGTGSAAARGLSDLMAAKDRIALSQYGLSTLAQNSGQRADLLLAPTQYSNAGGQINAAPGISAGQVQVGQANEINGQTLINSATAFSSNVQQRQFKTNLEQQTQQFNANNTLQNNQFNTTNANNFALSNFSYLTGYVNSVAGAGQTDVNTQLGIQQQQAAQEEANRLKKETQDNNAAGAKTRAMLEASVALGPVAAYGASKIPAVKRFFG